MIEDVLNKLEKFNDPKFKFEEKYHRYTYDGKVYNSVTRFIQNFHKPFEEEYWSNKKAEEAGVPQEWILKQWKEKNDRANYLGSETHNWIENYYQTIQIFSPPKYNSYSLFDEKKMLWHTDSVIAKNTIVFFDHIPNNYDPKIIRKSIKNLSFYVNYKSILPYARGSNPKYLYGCSLFIQKQKVVQV
jgi:hypothetical protein